jgi:hypothetical protein
MMNHSQALDDIMTSSALPFDQAWSQADTAEWINEPAFPQEGTPTEQEAWRRTVAQPRRDKLALAVGRHMAWLLSEGQDLLPPHAEHVSSRLLHALRELINHPTDARIQMEAGQPFAADLDKQMFVRRRHPKEGEDTLTAIDQALRQKVIQGEFDFDDRLFCHASGQNLTADFKNWSCELGVQTFPTDPVTGRFRRQVTPIVAGQIPAQGTHTCTIPVPSGHLLVADWLRIPAFNELTKPVDDDEAGEAINSIAGRAERTRRYAERLGVVHVFGGSPSLLTGHGVIKVGHLDPNAPEPTGGVAARISADLRWTTIVDRAHLVTLLTPSLGAEGAEKEISAYERQMKRECQDLFHLHVAPGTHHLYFAGDYRTFSKTVGQSFASEGLYLEDFESPGFALTADPLQAVLSPSSVRRPSGP